MQREYEVTAFDNRCSKDMMDAQTLRAMKTQSGL